MMYWAKDPGIQSQRLRLEEEVSNSESRIKLPIPKIPTGILKASGKNRTTKNNPALILHQIPNNFNNDTTALFKIQAERYNFDWIEGPIPNSEENYINNVYQELNTTLTLYRIRADAWIYQLSSYYINFYAYSVPQKLQPNLIAIARDPLDRQWERMKRSIIHFRGVTQHY